MPGKYKSHHGDEYSSDDMEATDTLIGRNRVASSAHKKTRSVSATKKKTPKRPVTPGSARKRRPQSAPSARSGRELWLNAVKNRQTVGLAGGKHPTSPRHKTASEYWIDTLRKTGQGMSTESTGMNTFRGKHPNEKAMPYLSTSAYMRQLMGTEKPSKKQDMMAKPNPGTPAYKSQEEYYEQILEYKKQVAAMNQDNSALKAKIRRLEEDNLKKEKEITGLLDPTKSEEVRRTLADKRPDSGAVIHSLKQKILKLETQLKEKETTCSKLQSDLKTTKIEEMRQQMEVFCQEIVRLQNSKETGIDKSARPVGKENTTKVKALNETVIRLSKTNEQLQAENRSLKEDLNNALDGEKDKLPNKEYEDMDRKQLLRAIRQLERKLERPERHLDSASLISYESRATDSPGKIALQGSVEERLEQLDHRENELLEKCEKNRLTIQQLRDEKARLKKRCEELERIVQNRPGGDYDLASVYSDSRAGARRSASGSRPGSARPLSGKSDRPLSGRQEKDRPVSGRSERERVASARSDKDRPTSARSERNRLTGERLPRERPGSARSTGSGQRERVRRFTENHAAKTIQTRWRGHQNEKQSLHRQKVDHFRENHAAKTIQRRWTGYRKHRIDDEQDEAADLIRSSLLGHTHRQRQMQRYMAMQESDDEVTEDEEYNECVDLIQSALRGHNYRSATIQKYKHLDSAGEEDDDDDDIMLTPKHSYSSLKKPTSIRPQSGKSRGRSTQSNNYLESRRTGGSHYSVDDDDF